MKRNLIAALAAAAVAVLALPAHAGNIVDEWASVKAPAAPALKPADRRQQDLRPAGHRHGQ